MVNNKTLVRELSKALGLSIDDAQLYVDALSKIVLDSICDGNPVDIRGLGKFRIHYDRSKKPRTEEEEVSRWSARFVFCVDADEAIKRSLHAHEDGGESFFSEPRRLGD